MPAGELGERRMSDRDPVTPATARRFGRLRLAPSNRLGRQPQRRGRAIRATFVTFFMTTAVFVYASGAGTVISAPPGQLFADDFESGSFVNWSSAPQIAGDGAATVQTAVVKSGTYAARFLETSTTGSGAYIRETLSPSHMEIRAAGDFQVRYE